MREIKSVGVIGTGLIGAGWVARLLARGLKVVVWDPSAEADRQLHDFLDRAWPAVSKLGLCPDASRESMIFASDINMLVQSVDFIQETISDGGSGQYLKLAAEQAPADVLVGTQSSAEKLRHAMGFDRVLSARTIAPVYLLPLVEITALSDSLDMMTVRAFYESVGMKPVLTEKAVGRGISDNLLDALGNANEGLLQDGVSPEDVDDALIHGLGLLSAVQGLNQSRESNPELQSLRDDCLVAIMQALRAYKHGAGRILQDDEGRRLASAREFLRWREGDQIGRPLSLYRSSVLPEWVDYNGHMTEAAYLTAFGWATDALFRYIGDDESYREAGFSFYTVETHINYFQECSTGDPLRFTTQLLSVDQKRMHLFHSMYHGHSGDLLATTEQMLLHVDMKAARACPIREDVYATLQTIMTAHADMEIPNQVGRQMAIRKS